jgi:hypothetical protein
MNKSSFGLLTFFIAGCLQAATPSPDAVQAVANAPLRFEPAGSGYVTRGLRFSSSLQGEHMDLRAKDGTKVQAMRVTFAHASPAVHLVPGEALGSKSNIIHGNDRTKWRTVENYRNVHASDLYPGVDLKYYGNHGELEYDLIVKPGADPRKIRLQFSGVKPSLDADGNLTAAFIQRRPVAYQIAADGFRKLVASRYRRNADGTFGFALARYDKSRELVIDPTLTFSLYIFGSNQDTAKAIGHDANGNIYVAGITLSTDFEEDPNNNNMMPGGPQGANNSGGYDCFIVQVYPTTPAGENPVAFATYLGGSGDDILNDMFVAPNGLVYLTGWTNSVDFPQGNVAAYQNSFTGNTDAFVVIYDLTQPVGLQIVYMSYLGGGTGAAGNGVVADSKGRVYIVGTTNSSEVPTVNGLQGLNGTSNAFIAAFDATQSDINSLFFATFLGGSVSEVGSGITLAPDGTLWVVGQTNSPDFPMAGNSYQPTNAGGGDAFVAQLDPIAGALLYSTFFGGSGIDAAQRVRLDPTGRLIITGFTQSTDFPILPGAIQPTYGGNGDAFVFILNPYATGSGSQLIYSTYYGGAGAELATGLAVDAKGVIYVTGSTASPALPVTANALNAAQSGGQDGFVLRFDPTIAGSGGKLYASYIDSVGLQSTYGVDVDAMGTMWTIGWTNDLLFNPAITPKITPVGDIDGFLMGVTFP